MSTSATLDAVQPTRTLEDARAERRVQGQAALDRAFAHAKSLRARGHASAGNSLLHARQAAIDATADADEADHVLARLALAHGVQVMGTALANIRGPQAALRQRFRQIAEIDLPALKRSFADMRIGLSTFEEGQSRLVNEAKPIEDTLAKYDGFLSAWEATLPQVMVGLVSAYGMDALTVDLAAARVNRGEVSFPTDAERQIDDLERRIGRVDPNSTVGKHLAAQLVALRFAVATTWQDHQNQQLDAARATLAAVESGDVRAIADLDRTVRTTPEAFRDGFTVLIEAAVLRAVEASGPSVFVQALADS